ncbi:MAG: hypothetical protein MJ078_05000, partial [Clostridia bacterium]|nr:hypothetical protein [Clostridia bacterium]
GVFDATVSASSDTDRTEKILSAQMGIYRNLHIVFFSFGSDSNIVDMTKSKNALFQNNPSFSAYYAADATQITERMGRIANQLTGRYNADGVSMTGNKVVLDLSRCPCALRNVSFLLQNSDAVLTGVEYAPAQVQASRSCSLKVHQDIASGLKGGSTAVISGTGSISGGTMTLTFSKPLDGARLSVMYEPALYIKTVLYAKNQKGLWEETTVQSINETKRPGDLFRISYGVYEEGTDVAVNLKEMFKEEPDVRIFYGKNAVTPDTDTALSMGDNEINISVSVLDGGYNMYDTLNLKVSQNPTDFRVESHFVPGEPNTVLFTVYDDNHALTASAITGYQKEITVTDKAGNAVPFSSFVKADGSVQVTVDFPDAAYGAYSVSMKITSPNRLKRYGSLTLGYYPEEMSLIAGEPISTSVFGLSENRQTLSFALSSGGQPLDINEGLGYRVTCNGKDCTEWVTVTGNTLTLCPRTELFGTPVPGDYRFAAEVYVKANPTQTVSSAATLTVTETLYALTARSEGEAADRFDVGSGNAAAYYEFERDGKKLDAATVSSMIEDGTITLPEFVEQDFLRTVRLSYEVSDRDGVGVLKMAMTQNGGDFANFFSSMFLNGGEKKIAVSFAGLTETATLAVKKLSGFSSYLPYLLRGLLIFLAGYTLLHLFFLLRYFS